LKKSKDLLKEKAKEVPTLKDALSEENSQIPIEDNSDKPVMEINEKGEKVLVFNDPLHSREKRSIVNYAVFKGKWEFENYEDLDEAEKEKCAIKFTPISDGVSITLAFKSFKDRVEFIDSIYSDHEMKQVGTGLHLEDIANSKVLKTTGGIIGISLLGYGLYKLLGKGKE
jgi:hypothetical protein